MEQIGLPETAKATVADTYDADMRRVRRTERISLGLIGSGLAAMATLAVLQTSAEPAAAAPQPHIVAVEEQQPAADTLFPLGTASFWAIEVTVGSLGPGFGLGILGLCYLERKRIGAK